MFSTSKAQSPVKLLKNSRKNKKAKEAVSLMKPVGENAAAAALLDAAEPSAMKQSAEVCDNTEPVAGEAVAAALLDAAEPLVS